VRIAIEDLEIELLLEALFQRYHYDFRHYARASIKRRLQQARAQLGFKTISAMQDRLLHDPAMLPRLLDFLTVQVSEMFRDPSYFQALREKVLPHLGTYPSLKVWIAGLQHRRGGLFPRHPVQGGRPLRPDDLLRDRHQS
jgi:chemotaxis protein methyltransferase CheR